MAIEHAVIMMMPIFLACINIAVAFFLNSQEHNMIRLFMVIAGMGYFLPAIGFGFLYLNSQANSAWDSSLSQFLWMLIFELTVLLGYITFYLAVKLMRGLHNKKEALDWEY